jgi:hypothetical protein
VYPALPRAGTSQSNIVGPKINTIAAVLGGRIDSPTPIRDRRLHHRGMVGTLEPARTAQASRDKVRYSDE